jgi:hypothetical protein
VTSPIERASPPDLAFGAMGSGGTLRQQLGAVLVLGPGTDPLVVVHHLLVDGVGGLAVLASLVDGAALPPAVDGFPRPRPSWRRLAADAARSRAAAVARWRTTARQARAALAAAGGMVPPPAATSHPARRCLTGHHRRGSRRDGSGHAVRAVARHLPVVEAHPAWAHREPARVRGHQRGGPRTRSAGRCGTFDPACPDRCGT